MERRVVAIFEVLKLKGYLCIEDGVEEELSGLWEVEPCSADGDDEGFAARL